MGRTQQSQGLAPPAIRKDQRAKHARQIINKTIPAILASNARARKGAEGSELIVDPLPLVDQSSVPTIPDGGKPNREPEAKYIKRKGQGRRKVKDTSIDSEISLPVRAQGKSLDTTPDHSHSNPIPPRTTRIIVADTLFAAHLLKKTIRNARKEPNICILNMASLLRPGGGCLNGATSQEEFLCTKTTLLPSLNESFYRLPEYGGVFTRDVFVFGSATGELAPTDRYYVDAISAGMLRFPDLLGEEDEEKRLSKEDVSIVQRKMRAVLRVASSQGVKKLVLGAWGCGAYGNPVRDIAEAWRGTLDGEQHGYGRKSKSNGPIETWGSISEIVFAISNRKMAESFGKAFDPRIEVEHVHSEQNEESEDLDQTADELRSKIQEMESQLEKVWNADLKQRMNVILDGLRAQLNERVGNTAVQISEEEEEEEEENDVDVDVDGSEDSEGDDEKHGPSTTGANETSLESEAREGDQESSSENDQGGLRLGRKT